MFLACAVEAVEALTIVLAVGATRSWSSALYGVGAAVAVLAAIVAALGPALTALPISSLRLVVGGLLLVFGLQWLRKAVLRAAGLKALHDEAETFAAEAAAARSAGAGARPGIDGYSFAVAFKGVLLEGLEVAFIVLTFGANQQRVGLAAAAAAAAIAVVVIAGIAARAPLARVPENTLKFAVGAMLTSFGMFWGAEGPARRGPVEMPRCWRSSPGWCWRRWRWCAGCAALRAPRAPRARRHELARQGGAGRMGLRGGRRLDHGRRRRRRAGPHGADCGAGGAAWWVMPAAVIALLALSVGRAAR